MRHTSTIAMAIAMEEDWREIQTTCYHELAESVPRTIASVIYVKKGHTLSSTLLVSEYFYEQYEPLTNDETTDGSRISTNSL